MLSGFEGFLGALGYTNKDQTLSISTAQKLLKNTLNNQLEREIAQHLDLRQELLRSDGSISSGMDDSAKALEDSYSVFIKVLHTNSENTKELFKKIDALKPHKEKLLEIFKKISGLATAKTSGEVLDEIMDGRSAQLTHEQASTSRRQALTCWLADDLSEILNENDPGKVSEAIKSIDDLLDTMASDAKYNRELQVNMADIHYRQERVKTMAKLQFAILQRKVMSTLDISEEIAEKGPLKAIHDRIKIKPEDIETSINEKIKEVKKLRSQEAIKEDTKNNIFNALMQAKDHTINLNNPDDLKGVVKTLKNSGWSIKKVQTARGETVNIPNPQDILSVVKTIQKGYDDGNPLIHPATLKLLIEDHLEYEPDNDLTIINVVTDYVNSTLSSQIESYTKVEEINNATLQDWSSYLKETLQRYASVTSPEHFAEIALEDLESLVNKMRINTSSLFEFAQTHIPPDISVLHAAAKNNIAVDVDNFFAIIKIEAGKIPENTLISENTFDEDSYTQAWVQLGENVASCDAAKKIRRQLIKDHQQATFKISQNAYHQQANPPNPRDPVPAPFNDYDSSEYTDPEKYTDPEERWAAVYDPGYNTPSTTTSSPSNFDFSKKHQGPDQDPDRGPGRGPNR